MLAALPRALAGAVLGALAGAPALALLFALDPGVTIDMYRDLPRGVATGFYPVERAGEQPYAWTGRSAGVRFAGMRRSAPWECVVRFRGGRADVASLPDVEVAIDGIVAGRRVATNDYEDLAVRAEPMPRGDGLTLMITSSNVFVPGPGDPRELGIQVGHIGCRPADEARVLPPGRVLRHATVAAAVLGAGIGWAGVPALWGLLLGLMVVLGQAFLLSTGLGPYGAYAGWVAWFALGVAVAWFALLAPLGRGAAAQSRDALFGAALSPPARLVVLLAGAVFYLKVLGLLHPGKAIIDAVFHANRLQWVLDGRFFFTQPMPGGVSFPYAIGLYVFAAPWTVLTSDYVALLRVIVTAAEVTAGALLYCLVARVWGDRLVAVLAVLFFHAVPLPYGILGNANLTNVFGQATALVALVAAALLVPGWWRLAGFFAVCLLAFLSHISTFAVLAVTLVALAAWFWLLGGRELRRAGVMIVGVAAIAGVVSVAVYYGHFGEVYATALRSRTQVAAPAQPGVEAAAVPARATSPVGARLVHSARLTTSELGWPLLTLGALGMLHLVRAGARDRLGLLLAAYGVAYVVFFGFGVTARVDPAMERYATEFVGRVNLAAYPALAILAARGAAWAWRSGPAGQLAAAALIGSALRVGVVHWRGWIG
jgi:hypothetical protein